MLSSTDMIVRRMGTIRSAYPLVVLSELKVNTTVKTMQMTSTTIVMFTRLIIPLVPNRVRVDFFIEI